MNWWLEHVARPYALFLNDNVWVVMLIFLVGSSVFLGRWFHELSFESYKDYIWPAIAVVMVTALGPMFTLIFLFIFPVLAMLAGICILGSLLFYASMKNFWIKRGRK